MAQNAILEGVLAINKPVGLSSAQVIRDCQMQFNPSATFAPLLKKESDKRAAEGAKAFNRRSKNKKELRVKMGHGGTLDPLASGVLILGLGNGTKSLQGFLDCTKSYETVIVFGASTDTYDRVGRILTRRTYTHITKDMVLKAIDSFKGKIQQTPPLFSALKMEGKPLYEYAREGKPIPRQIPTREVDVLSIEMVEWYPPGSHKHYWPTEEAGDAERQLAQKVWKVQESNGKALTPEEEEEEARAVAAHEAAKRKFESDVDGLVMDRPHSKKKQKKSHNGQRKGGEVVMSGALGTEPTSEPAQPFRKGANLIPESDPNAKAPWEGEGPPAVKIRMTVTSGFYVRSLCHDLGAKLGSAAMMAELCRSRQGDFEVDGPNCLDYDDIAKGEEVWAPKVAAMLENWTQKTVAKATTFSGHPPVVAEPVERKELSDKAVETNGVEPTQAGEKGTVPPSAKTEAAAAPPVKPEASVAAAEAEKDDDEVSWKGFQD
ncbi:related to pseudouridine synthase [Cephalotrichum gorgonifer]|uniref:tRNA pseudouridine(55) synthase n=1 Tax=Cephalotrichum gorgonifer TaxID=2041049 RepID=A0AAE8MWZ4_9PEZI|nr:related to pseudouridine synthase [Cephalotrichum gorgonifer]